MGAAARIGSAPAVRGSSGDPPVPTAAGTGIDGPLERRTGILPSVTADHGVGPARHPARPGRCRVRALCDHAGYLREVTNGALSVADAYALCSVAVDFIIAEAVGGNKVVTAYIPESLLP
jgi:hypothetical protein